MLNYIYTSYKVLDEIYRQGAYSQIVLNRALNVARKEDRALITKIVYGVLDKNVTLEFYLSKLCDKKPKAAIVPLLKVGIYMIKFMDIPNYAATTECAKIAKSLTKGSLTGFVNGVLRKAATMEFELPNEPIKRMSVELSYPSWIIKRAVGEYGSALTEEMFSESAEHFEHVRANAHNVSATEFERLLNANEIQYKRSFAGGFYIKRDDIEKLDKSVYVYQSASSMLAVMSQKIGKGSKVLDLCAAPGGKSVFASEFCPNGSVTSCDVYEHKIELIKQYVENAGANNVFAELSDATVLRKDFVNKFDNVICDAPCSGIGVVSSKPDILLRKTETAVVELSKLQSAILENAAKYVKVGGTLGYSTCTIFDEENDEVIGHFLEKASNFCVETIDEVNTFTVKKKYGIQLLPNLSGSDGFYISVLKRKE